MKRAKQSQTPQAALSWPWLTLPLAISVLALGIALYSLMNERVLNLDEPSADDLQVFITERPKISYRKPKYEAETENGFTFINGGTRAAAVISVDLVFVDKPEEDVTCDTLPEKTIGGVLRSYDLEPLTLNAGAIVSRRVKLRKADPLQSGLEPMFADPKRQTTKIIVCYRFTAVAAGMRRDTWIFAGLWNFNADGSVWSQEPDQQMPFVLLGAPRETRP